MNPGYALHISERESAQAERLMHLREFAQLAPKGQERQQQPRIGTTLFITLHQLRLLASCSLQQTRYLDLAWKDFSCQGQDGHLMRRRALVRRSSSRINSKHGFL